jgi:hypothetical protein
MANAMVSISPMLAEHEEKTKCRQSISHETPSVGLPSFVVFA